MADCRTRIGSSRLMEDIWNEDTHIRGYLQRCQSAKASTHLSLPGAVLHIFLYLHVLSQEHAGWNQHDATYYFDLHKFGVYSIGWQRYVELLRGLKFWRKWQGVYLGQVRVCPVRIWSAAVNCTYVSVRVAEGEEVWDNYEPIHWVSLGST